MRTQSGPLPAAVAELARRRHGVVVAAILGERLRR
jgi:hypothetical protein